MNDVLKVEGIDAYYGSSQVLFKMSLTVRQGETLALLGRNGAGKSTIMKSIAGIVPPRAGRVRLFGQEMRGKSVCQIARAGIGFVPEDRQIFPALTVEDNLDIAAKPAADGSRVWTLEKVYDMLPLLASLKNRLGAQLSGGEQQLLTIGRTLMGNPSVMLLDEPSEGLSPIMVQKVGDLVQSLRQIGTTIVLAEQNLHFCLDLADRAVVIDKGSGVFCGTIDELDASGDVKRRYLSV